MEPPAKRLRFQQTVSSLGYYNAGREGAGLDNESGVDYAVDNPHDFELWTDFSLFAIKNPPVLNTQHTWSSDTAAQSRGTKRSNYQPDHRLYPKEAFHSQN